MIAVNHSFFEFPFAKALTFRTTMEDVPLVKDPFAAAAYRCIQSQFRNPFSGSHIAFFLYSPYQAAHRRFCSRTHKRHRKTGVENRNSRIATMDGRFVRHTDSDYHFDRALRALRRAGSPTRRTISVSISGRTVTSPLPLVWISPSLPNLLRKCEIRAGVVPTRSAKVS